MNLYDSLAVSDIVSLVMLSAVIFIPLGMFFKTRCFSLHFLRRMRCIFRRSLKDCGTFSDFINPKQ